VVTASTGLILPKIPLKMSLKRHGLHITAVTCSTQDIVEENGGQDPKQLCKTTLLFSQSEVLSRKWLRYCFINVSGNTYR
jgi:hypothetical protein